MTRSTFALWLALASGGLQATALAQTLYRPNDTFNTDNNPNGNWSYGWKQADANPYGVSGTFSTAGVTAGSGNGGALVGWIYGGGVIDYNTTNTSQDSSTVNWAPHEVRIHPTNTTPDSVMVLRFTAPADGLYALSSKFYKTDATGNGSTRIDVVFNDQLTGGLPDYTVSVSGYRYTPGSVTGEYDSGERYLTAGSTIDIQAGQSLTGYGYNSTGVDATITFTPVPEPSLVLAACAGMVLVAARLRRRFVR